MIAPRQPRAVHIDILCNAAGLHSGAHNFGYVAHWAGGDPKTIRQTAERVITAARSIL